MKVRLTKTSKMMAIGIAISLGWFILEACECEDTKQTKQQQFPGYWVSCIGNKPTLMYYTGDNPTTQVSTTSPGDFDPAQWDCTNPNSPNYKGSQIAPYEAAGPGGPLGFLKPHQQFGSGPAYLPQQFRRLPFMPQYTPPASTNCDSSFRDVLRAIHTEAQVTRISTCPFTVKTTIPVTTRPLQIQVTPDGSTALVTSFDNAINFIDLSTNRVSYTLKTDPSVKPHGLAISSDGTRAYVTSFNPDNSIVLVIDLASKTILATMSTITYPQGATLSPDGAQLWITSPLAYATDVFDTLTNTRIFTLNVQQSVDVAFNSTGTHAYITSQATTPGQVIEVDTQTFQTLNTYTVGTAPTDISMSYGDQFLVVNNSVDGSVSVIDLNSNTVKTANIGANPTGLAWVH